MGRKKDFLSAEEEALVVKAIKQAERECSGEIRVHLEASSDGDNYERAKEIFKDLGMTETELRNGVLFYLAIEDRAFSVLADKGIHAKCPKDFWDDIKDAMQIKFREGAFAEGLCIGIERAGKALKEHFPYQDGDENELSDEISKS